MIETASIYLANKLKQINPDETPSVNVMRYSIKFILLNFITLPLMLVATGLLVGDMSVLFISATGFVILRFFSGGVHINNAWVCAIVSVVAFHGLVFISAMIEQSQLIIWLLGVLSLILVAVYSPSNIEKQTKFKKENYKWLKAASIMLVLINLFIINNALLASAFFFQGLTLVTFGRGGEKK